MDSTQQIPEVQKIRERFPQIGEGLNDWQMLDKLSSQHPKVFAGIADKYEGSIKEAKPTFSDILGYAPDSGPNSPSTFDKVKEHLGRFIGGTLTGQFLNRPSGAVKAMLATGVGDPLSKVIGDTIKGFQRPDETASPSKRMASDMGVNLPDEAASLADNVLMTAAQIGMFGSLSHVVNYVKASGEAATNSVAKAFLQTHANVIKASIKDKVDNMHPLVKNFLVKAHQPQINASHEQTSDEVANLWSSTQGNVDTPATTSFGNLIRQHIIDKNNVPLHPASEGRLKAAALVAPEMKRVEESKSILPPYKDTAETNQLYLDFEKKAPQVTVPINAVKVTKKVDLSKLKKIAPEVKSTPIMVNDKAEVVDGHHRLATAKIEGKKTIQVIKNPVSSNIEKATETSPRPHQKFEDVEHPINKVSISPVQPEEIAKTPQIADEALQRQGNQSPKTLAIAKKVQAEVSPEIPSLSKDERLQLIKQRAIKPNPIAKAYLDRYSSKSFHQVTFKDSTGIHEKMADGIELKKLEDKGQVVKSRPWNKGETSLLSDFFEMIKNAGIDAGDNAGRVASRAGDITKEVGIPFYVASKYPPFMRVHMAFQDNIDHFRGIDTKAEQILNYQRTIKLPKDSQSKLADIAHVENDQELYFTRDEMIKNFRATEGEIAAHDALIAHDKYTLQLEIEKIKYQVGYDQMEPDKQATFDKSVRDQIDRVGGHYSTVRPQGNHVVWIPPEKKGGTSIHSSTTKTLSEAQAIVKKLGNGAVTFPIHDVPDIYKRNFYNSLSVRDLEHLAESANVDRNLPAIQALEQEIVRKRSLNNWQRRDKVEGYPWKHDSNTPLKNILDSAREQRENVINSFRRSKTKVEAEKALNQIPNGMSSLKRYAAHYIDTMHQTRGEDALSAYKQFIIFNKLAFKTGFVAKHLSESLSTTYPLIARHLTEGVQAEEIYLRAMKMAGKWIGSRITKGSMGISSEHSAIMQRLEDEHVTTPQMQHLNAALSSRDPNMLQRIITFTPRWAEAFNRHIAAFSGIDIAERKGITDSQAKYAFVKKFIYTARPSAGAHNLPVIINDAGSMRGLLRMSYYLKGYAHGELHRLSLFSFGKGANVATAMRAWGGLLGMAGIGGIPFAGLLSYGLAKATGHTLDHDLREAMIEAHIPNKAVDLSLMGIPSLSGMDGSSMFGLGDIIYMNSSLQQQIFGPGGIPVQEAANFSYYMSRGDVSKAMGYIPFDAASKWFQAEDQAKNGIRSKNGDVLLPPSQLTPHDINMTRIGIQSSNIAKAYSKNEDEMAMKAKNLRDMGFTPKAISRYWSGHGRKLPKQLRGQGVQDDAIYQPHN